MVNKKTTETNLENNFNPLNSGPQQAIQDIWDPAGLFGGGGGGTPAPRPDDTPGATGADTRHPDWTTATNNAVDIFKQSFNNAAGRAPTSAEINNYVTSVVNPAIANPGYSAGGKLNLQYNDYAGLANSYISTAFDPAKLRQQSAQANAQGQYGTIGAQVQSLLGRPATQEELDHYGALLGSGQADAYQIQKFIQATPEYQNKQDTNFRQGVDTQLQASDTNFFNTQKGNIAQQYAQMGRATSPALDVALTQLASQLNSQRGSYLAQLSASQYSGNKQAALGDYQNSQNQVQGQINQGITNSYNQNQAYLGRQYQLQDYNKMQSDFNAYAKQGQQGASPMGYLNAAGSGAAAGTAVMPGWGTAIGAGVGAIGYGLSQNR